MISDRYPELIGRINKFVFDLKIKNIKAAYDQEYKESYTITKPITRRSFWKISHPYFRSWDILSKR